MGSLREICVFSIRRGGIFLTGPSSRPSCVPSSVGCASPCILKALLATGQSVTLHDLSHSLHTHTFCLDILVNQKQMVSMEDQKLVSPSPSQLNGFGGVCCYAHDCACIHTCHTFHSFHLCYHYQLLPPPLGIVRNDDDCMVEICITRHNNLGSICLIYIKWKNSSSNIVMPRKRKHTYVFFSCFEGHGCILR